MFSSKSRLRAKLKTAESEKQNIVAQLESKITKLESENENLKNQLQQYWQILFNSEQETNKLKRKTNILKSRYEHYKKRSQSLKEENKNLNNHLRHLISKSRPQSRHRSRRHEKQVTIQTGSGEIVSPRTESTATYYQSVTNSSESGIKS